MPMAPAPVRPGFGPSYRAFDLQNISGPTTVGGTTIMPFDPSSGQVSFGGGMGNSMTMTNLAGGGGPPAGGPVPTSSSSSDSGPYAGNYLTNAADTAGQLISSAKQAALDQKGRLMDYINNLWRLRDFAVNRAKGMISKGANGQQNPLSVGHAAVEMAAQAGIPLEANIAAALMQGNNIENTLNDILAKATGLYTQMASIPTSHSQSQSYGGGGGYGGGGISIGGGNGQGKGKGGGQPQGNGIFTDIRGNKYGGGYRPNQYEGIGDYGSGNVWSGGGDRGFADPLWPLQNGPRSIEMWTPYGYAASGISSPQGSFPPMSENDYAEQMYGSPTTNTYSGQQNDWTYQGYNAPSAGMSIADANRDSYQNGPSSMASNWWESTPDYWGDY